MIHSIYDIYIYMSYLKQTVCFRSVFSCEQEDAPRRPLFSIDVHLRISGFLWKLVIASIVGVCVCVCACFVCALLALLSVFDCPQVLVDRAGSRAWSGRRERHGLKNMLLFYRTCCHLFSGIFATCPWQGSHTSQASEL